MASLNGNRPSLTPNSGIGTEVSTDMYSPPARQIFAALGITRTDLKGSSVQVSVFGLKYLIAEIVKQLPVDENWYLDRYPDVQAAVLAGDVANARQHFQRAGFLEGRLPQPLAFDADYYYEKYADLQSVFQKGDVEGLKGHFESKGYSEGRAGVSAHFGEAERWRLANDLG